MASSVLETFYFMFASNADKVKKGNDEAKKSAKELEDSQKKMEDQSRRSGEAYLAMAMSAGRAIAAVTAAIGTAVLVKNAIDYADSVRMTSAALNENVESVDTWSRVIKSAGGDVHEFQGNMSSLGASIREAAFTGEGSLSPVLRRLGINLREANGQIKTPLQLLPELAKAFERIDTAQALHLGKMMGLDDHTILLLKQGKANLDQLMAAQKQFQAVSEKDTEAVKKLKMQMGETSAQWIVLRQRIVMMALPALTWFFEKLEELGKWLDQNDELVQGFFIGAALAATYYFLPAMVAVAGAVLAATWPFLVLAAAITAVGVAVAIIYDEIMNFAKGHDSLIGEAIKKWPMLGKAIEGVGAYIKWLTNLLKEVASLLFGVFVEPEKAMERLANMGKSILGFFGVDVSDTNAAVEVSKNINIANDSIGMASQSPLASQTSNSIINTNRTAGDTSVSVEKIEVVTQATDAPGISQAIGFSMREQLKQVVYNVDDGVRI